MRTVVPMMVAILLGAIGPARSDWVLDNGAANNNNPAGNLVSSEMQVSEAFLLKDSTLLTGIQIATATTRTGYAPDSVTWEIGTTAFGSDVASGTASLSNSRVSSTAWESTFSLPELSLAAGKYYLTLENGSGLDNSGDTSGLAWLYSGESSSWARKDFLANEPSHTLPGESFEIEGSIKPVAIPEPSTLTLLGIAVVTLGGYGWRRRRQSA